MEERRRVLAQRRPTRRKEVHEQRTVLLQGIREPGKGALTKTVKTLAHDVRNDITPAARVARVPTRLIRFEEHPARKLGMLALVKYHMKSVRRMMKLCLKRPSQDLLCPVSQKKVRMVAKMR